MTQLCFCFQLFSKVMFYPSMAYALITCFKNKKHFLKLSTYNEQVKNFKVQIELKINFHFKDGEFIICINYYSLSKPLK